MKYLPLLLAIGYLPCKSQTGNLCIGYYAGILQTTQNNCIIIGDSFSANVYPSNTINYDRAFWYFKTPKGLSLLKYLDKQKRLDSARIAVIRDHISNKYLQDIQTEYAKRNNAKKIRQGGRE